MLEGGERYFLNKILEESFNVPIIFNSHLIKIFHVIKIIFKDIKLLKKYEFYGYILYY
jgi:hypothetical protein